jgi:hypothetical protein
MVKRSVSYVLDNTLLLVIGAAAGLLWANLHAESYQRFVHTVLLSNAPFGNTTPSGVRVLDLHFLAKDILMAFFFALAGKEIWEATHPGGAFHNPRHAGVPLLATLGGMVGPAGLYLLGALMLGQLPALARGWAIPCATDIAFSYMVARRIFGKTHPAIPFLLLLAIADDFGGLLILAIFYTRAQVQFGWLALSGVGVVIAIAFKHLRLRSFWWYCEILLSRSTRRGEGAEEPLRACARASWAKAGWGGLDSRTPCALDCVPAPNGVKIRRTPGRKPPRARSVGAVREPPLPYLHAIRPCPGVARGTASDCRERFLQRLSSFAESKETGRET